MLTLYYRVIDREVLHGLNLIFRFNIGSVVRLVCHDLQQDHWHDRSCEQQ